MAGDTIKANELIQGADQLAKEMAALNKEFKETIELMIKGQSVFNTQAKSQSDLATRTNKVKKATTELEKIQARSNKITLETVRATEKLRQKRKALTDQVKKEQGTLKKSNGLFRSMTKSILAAGAAMFGITAIIGKVVGAIKDAIVVNRQFETTFANVLTLLTKAEKQKFGIGLEKGAIDIVANYGLAIEDVNKALFDAISAGIPAGEAIEFLNRSARTAIAGNAELSSVVDGATNVIGAYGDKAGTTTEILNAFFAAQVKGKTTVGLLATNIGKVASTAAAADIPLNELFGTFAGLTKFIGGTEESATSLAAIMKTIIKPTSEAKKVFKDLGIETGITGLKNNGLLNTLKQVADAYEDNNDVLGDLVPNVRAFKGIAGLTAESIAEIESNITELNDTELSSILVQEAFNEKMRTQQKQAELLRGNWQRLLITIGGGENVFKRIGTAIKASLSKEIAQAAKNIERLKIAWDRITGEITKAQAVEAEKQLQIRFNTDQSTIESVELTAEEILAIEKKAAEDSAELRRQISAKQSQERDEEVEKEIKRLQKELAAKEALQLKAKQDSDALADQLVNEEIKLTDEELERLTNQIDEEFELKQAAAEADIQLTKDTEEAKKQVKIAAAEIASELVSDIVGSRIDADLAAFQADQEAKEKSLQNRLDKGEISEKKYESEVAALKKKSRIEAAKAEKKKAILDASLAAIVAVIKQVAATPPPVGIPFIVATAAIGALQVAAAAAKPIPKFKYGTDGQLQLDTTAIVGDGGKPELITTPKGDFLSPATDTMVHLPRGSQVFSGDSPETQAALSGGMTKEMYEGLRKEQQLTRVAIQNQKQAPYWTDKGLNYRDEAKKADILWIKNHMR